VGGLKGVKVGGAWVGVGEGSFGCSSDRVMENSDIRRESLHRLG
jgi:hypothetical protein